MSMLCSGRTYLIEWGLWGPQVSWRLITASKGPRNFRGPLLLWCPFVRHGAQATR